MAGLTIRPAESVAQIAQVRELLAEYWNSRGLSFSVFDFDRELGSLPGSYAPPDGRLLLAELQEEVVGCVALRRIGPETCEMKRLYLRPAFRGRGFGRQMAEAVIDEARRIGYTRMRLDTIGPVMKEAIAMYKGLGFKEISPYRNNPLAGAMYMELEF